MATKKANCDYCGAYIEIEGWERRPFSCGERDCERGARDDAQQEREEAHERLDRDMGW